MLQYTIAYTPALFEIYISTYFMVPRIFRRGMHDLHVWPDVEADGCEPSKTPGKTSDPDDKMCLLAKVR